ncbi:MAG TPA: restriction endonuclease [Thiobacillaceae bacterium]|nr:restriction endonuclease [Thiobacillaceae bacterium]HNF88230.1 restriction endonuclease [Thiobacillaceae bacterium]HNH88774.1 restriction endonuclease [Thiobacillaceae bacterium]
MTEVRIPARLAKRLDALAKAHSKKHDITTSTFSKEAHDYASRIENKIVLIDGEQLAQLMIDHGLGVSPVALFEVKKLDSDYFSEQ